MPDSTSVVSERIARYTAEAEPFLERFAGSRTGHRSARQPHARWRHGHDVHRHHAERGGRRSAGARQRNAGAARPRAHQGARRGSMPSWQRAKAAADDANVSKTRFLAAASHDILQPLNAARLYVTSLIERQARRRGRRSRPAISTPRSRRSRRYSARCLDISRLDTGAMKPDISRFPHRRIAGAGWRSNSRRWRAKKASISSSCRARSRCDRTAGCCAGCCRTSSPTRSNTRQRARAGRLPPPRGAAAHRRVRHRHRHSACQAPRGVHGISPARSGREGGARPRAWPLDRRAHRPRARPRGGAAIAHSAAARISPSRCRVRAAAAAPSAAVPRAVPTPGSLPERSCCASTTIAPFSTAWTTLLGGWGCRVLKAADLAEALAAMRRRRPSRTGFWSTITSTAAMASAAIAELRRRYGPRSCRRS